MKPKIFVGTMYCGEGDFEKCKNAILNQVNVETEHFIVQDKPEKEAHDTLFTKWNQLKKDFSLFVKVDADTVLNGDDILKKIFDFMYSDKDITGLQIPIYDYFTDSLIAGLNCFKPEVIFNTNSHHLYCDRVDSGHKKQIVGNAVPEYFIPGAHHCNYATNKQAYHYGVHRALKNQRTNIQKVYNAWKTHKDDLRLYALIGADHSKYFANGNEFNYTDDKFINHFKDAENQLESYKIKLR